MVIDPISGLWYNRVTESSAASWGEPERYEPIVYEWEANLSAVEQSLVGQITDQVQELPEDLRQQVLDFVSYLHAKYLSARKAERDRALAATFGTWQDERGIEQVIQDIYAQRTASDREFEL